MVTNAPALSLVVACGPVGVVGAVAGVNRLRSRRSESAVLLPGQRAAVLALYCAIASTFVFRGRSTDEISANPLDGAGLFRLAFLALAGVLAISVLREQKAGRLPPAARNYGLYICAALPGLAVAVQPSFVLFRIGELAVFWLVAVALWAAFGGGAEPMDRLRRALLVLAGLVAAGVLISPGQALAPSRGGLLPWRLTGVFPIVSANSVGMFGVLIFAYGLARTRRPLVVGGLALVALSQYRTGYVAALAVYGTYLLVRRGAAGKLALLACIAAAPLLFAAPQAQEAWNRGESADEVAGLNSRRYWWEQSLEVAERSPLFGVGLSSGTRFEALAGIGRRETSSVHSTWIEAYTGTGVVGLLVLTLSGAAALGQALRARRDGEVLPLLLLVALAVRSITGATIELASIYLLVFLLCAIRTTTEESNMPSKDRSDHVIGRRTDRAALDRSIGTAP